MNSNNDVYVSREVLPGTFASYPVDRGFFTSYLVGWYLGGLIKRYLRQRRAAQASR